MHTRTIGALGAIIVLALAGCGGSSKKSSGSSSSGTLSKSEFISQVDATCKSFNDQEKSLGTPSSAADIGPFIDKAVALLNKQISQLQTFESKAPAEVKSDYSKALALLKQDADVLGQVKAATTPKIDTAKVQQLESKGQTLGNQANALAKKIGLSECGKG
jgi:hypothetical protein